jgi:hypothetical protein
MKKQPNKALLISNGIEGLNQLYVSNDIIEYDIVEIDADFNPNLTGYDVLIAPNGTDHVAFYRIKDKVQAFLDNGGILFCFDGWFTNWIPNNRWIMDNSKKTIDVRYKIKDDPFGLSKHFDINDLTYSNGMTGWWACGYIEPSPLATVFVEDTWGRPLVVIDDASTNGLMILTASGPAADLSYATTDDNKAYKAMTDLYTAFIHLIQHHKSLVK